MSFGFLARRKGRLALQLLLPSPFPILGSNSLLLPLVHSLSYLIPDKPNPIAKIPPSGLFLFRPNFRHFFLFSVLLFQRDLAWDVGREEKREQLASPNPRRRKRGDVGPSSLERMCSGLLPRKMYTWRKQGCCSVFSRNTPLLCSMSTRGYHNNLILPFPTSSSLVFKFGKWTDGLSRPEMLLLSFFDDGEYSYVPRKSPSLPSQNHSQTSLPLPCKPNKPPTFNPLPSSSPSNFNLSTDIQYLSNPHPKL